MTAPSEPSASVRSPDTVSYDPPNPCPQRPGLTMFGPDFPFAYDAWLAHPDGLGAVPEDRRGSEVAVIGAGVAGTVAAYELLRLGLRPVVYEAEQIGGRMRSTPFEGMEGAIAEMGAMRFPSSARALFHYIDALGLRTEPFQNPLAPATPSTVVDLKGVPHWARSIEDLPAVYQQVADYWDKALEEVAEFSAMTDAIRRRDIAVIKAIWNRLLQEFDDESFYGFLAHAPSLRSFRHREVFGAVGFGSGGWDTDFPNSVLEVLRVVYSGADVDHQRILGGCQQIPEGLWRRSPPDTVHWPAGTSLASLHDGVPHPAITALRRAGSSIEVTDAAGTTRSYAAVVFTAQLPVLLTRVNCDPSLLSNLHWTAVERTHYMGSSKLFVAVDRPFWLDCDPTTGRDTLSMTLTDRLPRGMYLFDNGPDQPAVMCLSYTWNDDSMKFATLDVDTRLNLVLASLRAIYPTVDIRSHIVGAPLAVTWETEPHFMGAFKQNLPGHYRYQRRLFTHFVQRDADPAQRGFFLAGDDVSWTGGFAEGAVTTALNAVWGVLTHLGGSTRLVNPGPGDVYDAIAPLALP